MKNVRAPAAAFFTTRWKTLLMVSLGFVSLLSSAALLDQGSDVTLPVFERVSPLIEISVSIVDGGDATHDTTFVIQ